MIVCEAQRIEADAEQDAKHNDDLDSDHVVLRRRRIRAIRPTRPERKRIELGAMGTDDGGP